MRRPGYLDKEMSLSQFVNNVRSPRSCKRFAVIQLLVAAFILYLWFQFNGGFVPKFLVRHLPSLDVGPDVSVLLYFGDIQNDGSKLKFSGSTNNKDKLQTAVADNNIHMIEGSVILKGQGTSSQSLIPVMAIPPKTDSQITLDEWLDTVKSAQKGIKLIFTSIEAVEVSLEKLKSLQQKGFLKFPVWLHADVLQGPFGKAPVIDSTRFLRHVKRLLPKCTLSLGWTRELHTDTSQSGYTWEMVLEMYKLYRSWDIDDQPIVINAYLSYLRNSVPQLKWLIDNILHSSLVILHSPNEMGAKEDIFYAAYRFPPHKLFFDLRTPHLDQALSKYRHFSQQQVNPLVLKRDLVMFHDKAWVKMGFHMERDSALGSTEGIILTSPIVYIVSKAKHRPTDQLSFRGRVIFINYDKKKEEESTGLHIYLRSTAYRNYEEIIGISCFLGVDGTFKIQGSNLPEKDSFKSRSHKITPSSSNCYRFEIIDTGNEIIFRVNVQHDCNTLDSVQEDNEIHSELRLNIASHIGLTEHPYILRTGDNKRYVVIDELQVKHK